MVYFSEVGDPTSMNEQGNGQLKILECLAPACKDADKGEVRNYILTSGPPGYGRDPSLNMLSVRKQPGNESSQFLMVSFLDLNGKDEPESMSARLAVFSRSTDARISEIK
mmetsp:Transcript_15589/g.35111  ORF Transcript_15589/g.35111 Transcript_15589/m.35111 type:complete len:110 (+) Transcript_15589:825-1154(+)